ncbi:ABC transporter permease [Ventrimonas sp. CLA-AP-H27]|uniref:ABC transporter permease n=1 Tax=Ventrimonas faecis TaxID=3133170 RepID=A0ABV1HM71_9FIRM
MADNNPQLQSVIRFQEAYMEQEKFHKRKVRTIRSMLLVLFLALWELCTRLDMIDDFIFSSPSRVLFCFWKMVRDGSIFAHIGITLFETVVSFLIVTVAGIFVAVLLWTSRSASEVLEPYLVMLNSLPKSALAPMLIVWMGSHVHTIIAAAVSVAVFGSILTLHTGFSSMDPDKIRLIYALGGSKKDVLTKVLLPGSVPLILSNMKVNVGLCLVGVIIGEFLAARRGLGYLIIYGSQVFQLDCVMLSIVLLCLFSALLYKLIAHAETTEK